jgi:hypothetical protein
MKHLKLFEDLPSMWDPTYSNGVFSIRYRSINDLSNKKAPDTIDEPVNDLLDGIEEGDIVTGKGVEDEKAHTGKVVRIEKDEKGMPSAIEIEEDGEVIELGPGSVKFAEGGDKGHTDQLKNEPVDTGNRDYMNGGGDQQPTSTFEGVEKPLTNLKSFGDFK